MKLSELREQLSKYAFPEVVDVNGIIDDKTGHEYIGNAYRQPDGMYRCLANVNGTLARVEVSLRKMDRSPLRFVMKGDEGAIVNDA